MRTSNVTQWSTWVGLAVIVLVAFWLRVYGNDFDLPHISHPDEENEVYRALRLAAGNFEWERVFKGGYFYLLFIEYGVMFVFLYLSGVIGSVSDYMNLFFQDPTLFWLVGRTTTAVISTLGVVLVFGLARKLSGDLAGLLAAAFLAFCGLDVLNSHFITVDVPLTFATLVLAWFSLRIFETNETKYYVLAGLATGVALAIKISSAPFFLTFVVAHVLARDPQSSVFSRLTDRRLLVALGIAAATFLFGQPGAIFYLPQHLVKILSADPFYVGSHAEKVSHLAQALWYAEATIRYLGWPLTLSAIGGMLLAIVRWDKALMVLMVIPVCVYATVVAVDSAFLRSPRYILPAVPFMTIFAATLLSAAFRRWGSKKTGLVAVGALAGLVVLDQAIASIGIVRGFELPGTPIECRNWVQDNIPEGARILVPGYPGVADERRICPLEDRVENMLAFASQLQTHSEMGARLVRGQASARDAKRYDLLVVKPDDPWPSLETAKASGVKYAIIPAERAEHGEAIEPERRYSEFYSAAMNSGSRILYAATPTLQRPDGASQRAQIVLVVDLAPPQAP